MNDRYDRIVGFDLFYVFTLFSLILLGFCMASMLVKKFGVKRTCRFIRFVVSLNFLLTFMIYIRHKFLKGPKVAVEEQIDNIVENDEEYVKEIM